MTASRFSPFVPMFPLVVASLLLGGVARSTAAEKSPVFSNSPSPASFALDARSSSDESKVSTLIAKGRSQIKLDFIPVDERTSRAKRGYPSVTSPEGAYGVEGHGSPHSVFERNGEPMSAKELATWIRNDSRYEVGMTVYLMCCETGKGNRPIAQQLADTLGTEVVAPTEKLWPLQNGDFVVAQERIRKSFGRFPIGEQRADITRLGAMKTFKPGAAPTGLLASFRDRESPIDSSSSAASVVRTQQTPKKPLLRASAKTAALLAGIHGNRDRTLYLNSRTR